MEIAAVFAEAQQIGLVGPGSVNKQIEHAVALCRLLEDGCGEPRQLLDLGSGAGLPGLVAARHFERARVTLLDSRSRSTQFLERAAAELQLESRVNVVLARAESVSHDPAHRERYSAVIARAVAPAPVVAELGAGLVSIGGCLAVSEPPGGSTWDEHWCRELGLDLDDLRSNDEATLRLLRKRHPTPARWPRREGVPAKRPLW